MICHCLQAREHVLQVHNPTDILACLKTLVEGRDSPFQVAPREAELQPHESMPVKVRPAAVCLLSVMTGNYQHTWE